MDASRRLEDRFFLALVGVVSIAFILVVLPFFGPSTLRDTAGMPIDMYGDLWTYKRPTRWRNVGVVVRIVDRRAQLLDASTLLEDAALDKYDFVRDAYVQRRQSQIDRAAGPGKEMKEEAIKP